MSFLTRWKQSSVVAKVVAVLAALLLLEISLCATSPSLVESEGGGSLAVLSVVTFILFIGFLVV